MLKKLLNKMYIIKTVIVTLLLYPGCLCDTGEIDDNATSDEVMMAGRRIVNGTQAPQGSHPHMVALTVGPMIQALFCGGSLVTQRTVLTAAHCIDVVFIKGSLSSTLRATVGTNCWNEGGETYTIDRNITHPQFYRAALKNDIGLLITTTDVVLSRVVKPIGLTYDVIPGGVLAEIAGWGRLGTYEPASDLLQELKVPTISAQECTERYAPFRADSDVLQRGIPEIDPRIEICTFYSKGTGFCKGDSGSALTRVSDGLQIGIVSWGILCARGAPDVYARISGYAEWLQENII